MSIAWSQPSPIIENIEVPKTLKNNDKLIENYIYSNPLFGVLKIQRYAQSQNIKISKTKIKMMIFQIRNEVFPPLIEEAISDEFCKTKGSDSSSFFQARLKIRVFNDKKKEYRMEEFIIFGSNYMLSQFRYSKRWFIDGTFKIVPSGFYQIIAILVDSTVRYQQHIFFFQENLKPFMRQRLGL